MGIVMSLVGDVALSMEGDDWFVYGLSAFLVAHIAYIIGFIKLTRKMSQWEIVIPVLFYGIILNYGLWPYMGDLRPYITGYAFVLLVMCLLSWQQTDKPILAVGGTLFVLSDSLLAVNKFAFPIPLADVLVMLTYMLAQWMLVVGFSEKLVLKKSERVD